LFKSNKFIPFLSNNQYLHAPNKEASEQEYMILISIKLHLQLPSCREQGKNDQVDILKATYIETNLSKLKDLPAG
jgi:hypothetical protein